MKSKKIEKIEIENWSGKTFIRTNGGSELETIVWKINEIIDLINSNQSKKGGE